MYSAVELSKYIVTKCVKDRHPISNLQLQKILYYIQKDFLQHEELAFPDIIEAWQFGPVVPNVYYFFSGFGAMPITGQYAHARIDESDILRIDAIVKQKRDLDPWEMVRETHKNGGAWAQIWRNGAGNRSEIPVSLIKAVG